MACQGWANTKSAYRFLGNDRVHKDVILTSRAQAIEKLQWYAMCWKIETFYKIMKSDCKVEQSKLRTSERLVNLIALYCILGWRIFWTK